MNRDWLFLVYTIAIHALALLGLFELVRLKEEFGRIIASSTALLGQ